MKKNPDNLFFVNYEPRRMLLATATMSRTVELAHRKLFDYTWSQGHPPPNDPTLLASIAQVSPRGWPKVAASLLNHGWRSGRKSFSHPEAMRILRRARAAYEQSYRGGVLSGQRRREQRDARNARVRRPAAKNRPASKPVPINVKSPPGDLPKGDLQVASNPLRGDFEGASNPLSRGLGTPLEAITINDKR